MARLSFAKAPLLSGTALALLLGATPSLAQPAAVAAPQADTSIGAPDPAVTTAAADTIVVTGSRLASPTLGSPIPVTSLSLADLTRGGDVSIGDALNDLPSLRSSFSQSNSTQYIGTAGLNLLDLRGLGVSRTLVLVNGRRHIPRRRVSSRSTLTL